MPTIKLTIDSKNIKMDHRLITTKTTSHVQVFWKLFFFCTVYLGLPISLSYYICICGRHPGQWNLYLLCCTLFFQSVQHINSPWYIVQPWLGEEVTTLTALRWPTPLRSPRLHWCKTATAHLSWTGRDAAEKPVQRGKKGGWISI